MSVQLTFPATRTPPARTSGITVFTDQACTRVASITSLTGVPYPNGRIDVGSDDLLPEFIGPAGATVLYAKTAGGVPFVMHPAPITTVPTVTGAKGGNAALTSLMTALAASGIVVDATT